VVEPVTALGRNRENRPERKEARDAKKAARRERRDNKKAMRYARKHPTAPPTSRSPFVPSTGGNSTGPATELQGSKPIPNSKSTFFKARASVGGSPGTTDPVLQDDLNSTSAQSFAASAWNEQHRAPERRALNGDVAEWTYEKELARRRRLTPMLRGNFAGIDATG